LQKRELIRHDDILVREEASFFFFCLKKGKKSKKDKQKTAPNKDVLASLFSLRLFPSLTTNHIHFSNTFSHFHHP